MIKEINREMTWDELAEKYPDHWVFIDEDKTGAYVGLPDVCFVLSICSMEYMHQVISKCRKIINNFSCYRTTDANVVLGALV